MSAFLDTLRNIHPILVCLMVCGAKIVEISIQSLKTCMMVKGQRMKAAMLGFVECMIWGLVISTLVTTLGDDYLLLVFYCFGYAVGLFLGSTIESKIAIGTSNLSFDSSTAISAKLGVFTKFIATVFTKHTTLPPLYGFKFLGNTYLFSTLYTLRTQ